MTGSITTIDGKVATFHGGDFGDALECLKGGGLVQRDGWNGRGMWLRLEEPSGTLTKPFIAMRTAEAEHVPWLASQTDLLATDWVGYLPLPPPSPQEDRST